VSEGDSNPTSGDEVSAELTKVAVERELSHAVMHELVHCLPLTLLSLLVSCFYGEVDPSHWHRSDKICDMM
jgi:hypothetical protein